MSEDFNPLSADILRGALSEIKPIVGGGGFAFTKLDVTEKSLNHLGNKVQSCSHLRQVILSNNQFDDITPVSRLRHVLTLQADNNAITSIDCFSVEDSQDSPGADLPWCQRIDLSTNKLTALPSLAALVRLRFLRLESNEIATLEAFGGHPAIEELELQGNKLTSLRGLGPCGKLRRLNVSGNQLESLEGLDAPVLTYLNISSNSLASLEHIGGAVSCSELDVGGNQIAPEVPDSLPTEFLRLGKELQKLKSLALAGNPAADLKSELIICAPQVKDIDGEAVTDDDRVAATERHEEIKKAEEQRAIEKAEADAEAARAAAEAEAAAAAEAAEGGGD